MAGFGRARRSAGATGVGCAVLLGAGCAAGKPAVPAPESAHQAPAKGRLATDSARRALAARYLVIAKEGNRRLDADFGRLEGRDRNSLAARYLVIAKEGNRRLDADFGRLEGRDRNSLAA